MGRFFEAGVQGQTNISGSSALVISWVDSGMGIGKDFGVCWKFGCPATCLGQRSDQAD
jgi:hypothetical protein